MLTVSEEEVGELQQHGELFYKTLDGYPASLGRKGGREGEGGEGRRRGEGGREVVRGREGRGERGGREGEGEGGRGGSEAGRERR